MQDNTEPDELVMRLFDSALEHPHREREAYLRSVCAGDEVLFKEVWERLEWEDRLGAFLTGPLVPRAELDHPFEPGQMVAERFLIINEIAEGGMAVVYEALDQRLDQRVAIKCPKAEFRRRLPPEVRSALQVSHFNVCRVYEIHHTRTPVGEVDFLTMEFIEGETLSERLRDKKPLSEADAREIALQICAGLVEAHRNAVIHGDLKSNNVILTKTPDGQLRAVIMDFGLARQALPGTRPSAAPLNLYGTPDYMAPELWQGEERSVASDIYALGVILHEIVTGRRPVFKSEAESRVLRLAELPEAPSRLNPGLDPQWDRTILRCLEPEPSSRFQSAREVIQALESRTSRKWLLQAVASLAVLLALASAIPDVRNTIMSWFAREGVRLAVLEFDADPEARVLGSGVLHDVTQRLTSLQTERSNVLIIDYSEAVQNQVRTPQQALARLGATHALHGSFRKKGEKLLVSAIVTDTRTERKLRDFTDEYEVADLAVLPKALSGTITAALNLASMALVETVSASAYPHYTEGIYFLRRDSESADSAIPAFEKAIGLDPNSALPYAGLAEAQLLKFRSTRDKFWMDRAQESVRKAESRNPDSAPVLLIAGELKQSAGWYEKSAQDFRRAIQLEPKNPDAHRRLAAMYESTNQPEDAIAAYQQAIEAQPSYYKPRMDLGVFYYFRSTYEEAAAQFRIVTTMVPDLAQGHTNLGSVYGDQGRYKEAENELRTALRLQESQGVLHSLGALLAYERRDAEAISFYERALTTGPPTFLLFMNLADSYRRSGRSSDAKKAYSKGLEIAETELVGNPRNGYIRAFVAYLCARLGDAKRAELEIAQALRFSPEDAKVSRRAVILYEALGRREDALRVLESASPNLLAELSRQPDLADLQKDSRFLQILAKAPPR